MPLGSAAETVVQHSVLLGEIKQLEPEPSVHLRQPAMLIQTIHPQPVPPYCPDTNSKLAPILNGGSRRPFALSLAQPIPYRLLDRMRHLDIVFYGRHLDRLYDVLVHDNQYLSFAIGRTSAGLCASLFGLGWHHRSRL